MKYHARLKRLARKNKAVISDDPDGLLSALQIAKRLMGEHHRLSLHEAVTLAVGMAAPKDEYRVWFQAVRAVMRHAPAVPPKDRKELIDVLTETIKDQGRVNAFAKEGPQP